MREQMIDIDHLFLGGETEGSTTSWKRASADSLPKADCVRRMKKFVKYWVIIRKTGNNISVTAGFYCSRFIPHTRGFHQQNFTGCRHVLSSTGMRVC